MSLNNVKPGSKNHGTDKMNGVRTDFGKDSSFFTGSKSAERFGSFGGGMTDLSRTLSGSSAASDSKKDVG